MKSGDRVRATKVVSPTLVVGSEGTVLRPDVKATVLRGPVAEVKFDIVESPYYVEHHALEVV